MFTKVVRAWEEHNDVLYDVAQDGVLLVEAVRGSEKDFVCD